MVLLPFLLRWFLSPSCFLVFLSPGKVDMDQEFAGVSVLCLLGGEENIPPDSKCTVHRPQHPPQWPPIQPLNSILQWKAPSQPSFLPALLLP